MTFFSDASTFARVRAALCPFTALEDLDEYAWTIVREVQKARHDTQQNHVRVVERRIAAGHMDDPRGDAQWSAAC